MIQLHHHHECLSQGRSSFEVQFSPFTVQEVERKQKPSDEMEWTGPAEVLGGIIREEDHARWVWVSSLHFRVHDPVGEVTRAKGKSSCVATVLAS